MFVLKMTVNGKPIEIEIEPAEMLSAVLRDRLGLIGTKIGCGEGECGACTVLVNNKPVDSCIFPAMKAKDCIVTTVEGLGWNGELDPVQEAFIESFASQCGYCTPGFIMSTHALLAEKPSPSREEIVQGLSGNLCRCTGYYQIISAVELAAKKMSEI